MKNTDWTNSVKSFSENWILGRRLRTFYNEKNEIVHCEDCSINRDDLLKSLKRLHNKDLSPQKTNKSKKRKKALKSRITDNGGLMGMITLLLLVRGWEHMMEKDGLWLWGLIIFSIGFFNAIPIVLKLIDGKGIKGW